eukprot:1144001-Pelagomonas_calceolata.AAC.1
MSACMKVTDLGVTLLPLQGDINLPTQAVWKAWTKGLLEAQGSTVHIKNLLLTIHEEQTETLQLLAQSTG